MTLRTTFGRGRGPWRPKTFLNSSPRSATVQSPVIHSVYGQQDDTLFRAGYAAVFGASIAALTAVVAVRPAHAIGTEPQATPDQPGTAVYHAQPAQRPLWTQIQTAPQAVEAPQGWVAKASPALFAVAVAAQPRGFIQTGPQEQQAPLGWVTSPSPGLYVVAASRVFSPVQTAPQAPQDGQAQVYSAQPTQRPLFGTIQTRPQDSTELPQSAVYTTTQRLQRPVWGALQTAPQDQRDTQGWVNPASPALFAVAQPKPFAPVLTSPQADQAQPGSAVYRFPPPSFVAGAPALGPAIQTKPQDQGLYEWNASTVVERTAALFPDSNLGCWWADGSTPTADSGHYTADASCTHPPPSSSTSGGGGGGGGWGTFEFSRKKIGKNAAELAQEALAEKPVDPEIGPAPEIAGEDDDEEAIWLLMQ